MTIDIEQLKADLEAGTPGPWTGHNMTHAEGRPMTPYELGEYVTNSVMLGTPDKFLFVSGVHADGGDCDVCHTGNGPRGDANTRLIAQTPDLAAEVIRQAARIAALEAKVKAADDALRHIKNIGIARSDRFETQIREAQKVADAALCEVQS